MLVESFVGGVAGGILRLAPEVLKLLDRKNEREHELRMANIEVTIAEKRIEAGIRAGDQQIDMATLDAMGEALRGQAEMAKAGGKFVAAVSALVRPLVTYWFVGLYSAHKIAVMLLAHEEGGLPWTQVVATTWGDQDWAIFSMILVFWFVGRVHERAASRG